MKAKLWDDVSYLKIKRVYSVRLPVSKEIEFEKAGQKSEWAQGLYNRRANAANRDRDDWQEHPSDGMQCQCRKRHT